MSFLFCLTAPFSFPVQDDDDEPEEDNQRGTSAPAGARKDREPSVAGAAGGGGAAGDAATSAGRPIRRWTAGGPGAGGAAGDDSPAGPPIRRSNVDGGGSISSGERDLSQRLLKDRVAPPPPPALMTPTDASASRRKSSTRDSSTFGLAGTPRPDAASAFGPSHDGDGSTVTISDNMKPADALDKIIKCLGDGAVPEVFYELLSNHIWQTT